MALTIVVPAHNEEHRIRPFLDAYLGYFVPRYGAALEFIVVVNYSNDRTADIVREYHARYPQIRLIEEPRRVGKGGALLLGFAAARGDLVGFVDADGATPPAAFEDLVANIGTAGAIIASRWLKGAVVSPRQPWSRRVASRVFNLMVRILFGVRISDTQCGAKLLRRETLRAILPHLGITHWAFDVDLIFQVRRAGYAIIERPTIWQDVSGSKVQVTRASLEMVLAMARLRLLYSPLRGIVTLYDAVLGRFIHRADPPAKDIQHG